MRIIIYQKYLKDYLTSLGKDDMEFADITEEFGNAYKAFLKRYKNFGPSQMNKCLCWLSKLVYLAVDYEILRANPLEDMEYEKKPAPKHRHISCSIRTISARRRTAGVTSASTARRPTWRRSSPCIR